MWIDRPEDLLTDKDLMSARVNENSSYYRANNLCLRYNRGILMSVEFEDSGEKFTEEDISDVVLGNAFLRFDCREKFEGHEELLVKVRAKIRDMPSDLGIKEVRKICDNLDKTEYVEFGKAKFGKDVVVTVTPLNDERNVPVGIKVYVRSSETEVFIDDVFFRRTYAPLYEKVRTGKDLPRFETFEQVWEYVNSIKETDKILAVFLLSYYTVMEGCFWNRRFMRSGLDAVISNLSTAEELLEGSGDSVPLREIECWTVDGVEKVESKIFYVEDGKLFEESLPTLFDKCPPEMINVRSMSSALYRIHPELDYDDAYFLWYGEGFPLVPWCVEVDEHTILVIKEEQLKFLDGSPLDVLSCTTIRDLTEILLLTNDRGWVSTSLDSLEDGGRIVLTHEVSKDEIF